MFCKWCGSSVRSGARVCSRCGRNVPALSDCGGFYDLVPEAPRGPSQPETKLEERIERTYLSPPPPKKGVPPVILWVLGGLLAATVLLQTITLIQLGGINKKIEECSPYAVSTTSGATEDTPAPIHDETNTYRKGET